ncbi:chromosome segregation protein SMC [Candidatus Woesearchaeota archaeon]|nr:chromosome segregation protein SMC [Candidatus Woesearchaeota archaeon]
MTVIKKIRATGFKSFAKPTELQFGKDYSAVLGPNGSGKSNVVDSLCFVLGRLSAKSLRADKSANLIYNGGKKGKPAKHAEVSVVFDNSNKDFPVTAKELEVKRIVNQKGNSIYKINGEARTRQQVLDVLRAAKINPDGHNIVLQGDITHMAEMPAEERRKVLEEISGISMFEEKKEKALRELERVDVKLNETEIVMTERETYLKELKKDRDQAVKYKELEKNINRNKATYLSVQIKNREDKLREIESRILKNNKDIDKIKEGIESIRKEIENKKEELNKLTERIESKGPSEALTSDIGNIKELILKSETRTESITNEIKRIEERKKQLNNSIVESDSKSKDLIKEKAEISNKLNSLKKEKASVSKQLMEFRQRHNLDSVEKELLNLDTKIDSIKNILTEKEEESRLLFRNKDQLTFKISNIEESIGKAANKKQQDELKSFKSNFKNITEKLTKNLNENSSLSAQLSNARNSLYKTQEEYAKIKAHHVSITESSAATLSIKRIKDSNIKGIHGTVSELAEVDQKYSLALEVAAGPRINSIVVENDKVASDCIRFLKEKKLGIATFLPLNKLQDRPIERTKIGHGLAIDLVKFDPKYRAVFNYVFSNTIVVDDIDSARKIGIGKIRMATLDGDLVESSGAMIGGYRNRKFGAFKEQGSTDKLENLEDEITRLRNIITTLDKRKIENDSTVDSLREEKANLEASIIKIEKSIPNLDINSLNKEKLVLDKELKKIESSLSSLEKEINSNKSILKDLSPKRAEVSKKITEKQNSSAMSKLEELEKSREDLTEKEILLITRLKNIDTQVVDMIGPEKENIIRIIKEHDKEIQNFNNELKELSKIVSNNNSLLKGKQNEERKLYTGFKQLFADRNKLNEEVQKKELKINNEENKITLFGDRVNNFSNEKAKVISEIAGFKQEFEPFEEVQLRKGINFEQLKDEIYKFEKMMKDMGNVNLRSLEIYNEVHKEYDQIFGKVKKLREEKNDVVGMITEIESKKTDVFMKTFSNIKKNFENIFSQLTTKGTAHLVLENQESPLEGGIQILVRISTDKYLDIKSLSGGEKTMTALAFIFAIQEYDPASFYVFDEVDAALDKRNSELLANLIKKYSEKAQYIVITHNDAVIHTASQLYGVSMRENGISNVVSLKI